MGLDEVDERQFEIELEFVRAVLNPPEDDRCVGTNKRGYPCQNKAEFLGGYCRVHGL